MHEMSLCEAMLRIVEDQARANDFVRVRIVRLEIGALSAVDPEALRFCFDAVTRGSVAEGARLEIETPPGLAWCHSCCKTVEIAARQDPCPLCSGYRLEVTGGAEMRIIDLEVE